MQKRRFSFYLLLLAYMTPLGAQVTFDLVSSDIVKARLERFKGSDQARETTLLAIFSNAGCPASNISQQPVPKRKEANVICVLPGETDQVILVGAHFDHVSEGSGVIDNWSGASLLPSLFQSLTKTKHMHTYIFVGFMGEESKEIGSRFYVNQLSKAELSRIKLMITIDSIGLGPTKVWASRSDKDAVYLLGGTAHALNLPLGVVNVDGFGESDEEPFLERGIKTITLHSVTSETSQVLHTNRDSLTAVSFHDYYDTYHLLAAYLAVLDLNLDAKPAQKTPPTH